MVYTRENFETLRIQLEQASKIVTSSNVSKEQRANSESLFLEFHKSKSPYEFCRYLLDTSTEPYIKYQSVTTLQEAALREWSLLPDTLLIELQNFLLNYVIATINSDRGVGGNTSQKYVERRVLQTIAVFYKRSKLDENSAAKRGASSAPKSEQNMVKDLIELFKTSPIRLKQMCCSLMLALLNEFSNTNKSTKLGLPNDSHFTAKRLFEQNEFKLMLVFVFETTESLIASVASSHIKSIQSLESDSKEMLMQLFALIDQSFSWEFTSSKHVLKNLIGSHHGPTSNSNTQTSAYLEPTPEFKEFFLNPRLVSLLFECYELVRDDADMAHAAIQPLIQLSTLNGPIFKDDILATNGNSTLRVEFFNNFIQCFLATFTKIQLKEYETFNLACLIDNLMSPLNIKKIHLINVQLVDAFFQLVCAFVINCFKAEKACRDPNESRKYLESYEKILIAWTSVKENLVVNTSSVNGETTAGERNAGDRQFNLVFQKYAQTIVEAFVHSRLSSYNNTELDKDDIQLSNDGIECESLDDDDEYSSEDDLHRHKEILYSIGEFAKHSLDSCLPLLSKLLNERYIQLTECLNQLVHHSSAKELPDAHLIERHLTGLSEDIHWLLLVSGFLLFEINAEVVDAPKIPAELMAYSIKLTKYLDVGLLTRLLDTLAAARHPTNSPPPLNSISLGLLEARVGDSDPLDPILRIVFSALQLCELEAYMFSLNMLRHLSPQVASTLMWFLKELSRSYLFMRESDYDEISVSLQLTFGQDTSSGIALLNYLLQKCQVNFYIWSAENSATSQTARLLLELVRHREMSRVLVRNESFWAISKIAVVNEMPWLLLPSSVKKLIIKSLILSCCGGAKSTSSPDDELQRHVFTNILKPLSDRFDALARLKPTSIHTESCIKEVMSLVETFNGIIEGAGKSAIGSLLPFVLPRLEQGVQLLDVYHNYGEIVELVLSMFNATIEKFLAYLSEWPEAKAQIYHCFLCLIQVFSNHNSGKRSVEANIEEDYFNDLLVFMNLLNTLHNSENDSFEPIGILNSSNGSSVGQSHSASNQLTSVDIILIGLKFLIPLMSQEMLKFQTLSIEYFKLISHMAYSNADKLFQQPFELFATLVNSIEYGINSGLGSEVLRLSLQCLMHMCNRVFTTQSQSTEYGSCLRNLFKPVFDCIFCHPFEMDLFEVYSSVLYSLMCCYQDTYTTLVNELVEQYAVVDAGGGENSSNNNVREKILNGFASLTPPGFQLTLEKRMRLKFASKFNEFCVKTYGLLFIR